MKYNSHQIFDNADMKYRLFDDFTNIFMEKYGEDYRKININNGELSAEQFRKQVGKLNFDLYSQTADACINQPQQAKLKISPLKGTLNEDEVYPDRAIPYSTVATELLEKMQIHSEKKRVSTKKLKNDATSATELLRKMQDQSVKRKKIIDFSIKKPPIVEMAAEETNAKKKPTSRRVAIAEKAAKETEPNVVISFTEWYNELVATGNDQHIR